MSVFAKSCLCVLLLNWTLRLVSSSQDVAVTITNGQQGSNEESDIEQEPSQIEKSKNLSNEIGAVKENVKNEKLQPTAWETVFRYMAKGNELKNQYGFIIPKLVEMKLSLGSQTNVFKLMSYLPYIILALQKANAPPANEQSSQQQAHGLGNMNLTYVLQDPENLVKLFSEEGRGQLATDSVRLLAGPVASAVMDKLMEELKNNASDKQDGITGIAGPHLLGVLQRSDSLKQLFGSEELTNFALNLLNTYMDSFLHSELRNTEAEILSDIENQKIIRQNEEGVKSNPIMNAVRGTLSDSVVTFFKVGYQKMKEKLSRLNSEANKSMANWKQMAAVGGNNGGTQAGSAGQFKNVIINNMPNAVLKTLATGQVLTTSITTINRYHLIPSLAQYFLPTGLSMDVLKFLSLLTYAMVKAQRVNMNPEIDKDKVNNESGLNTETIVDTLNDKNIMAKIFPLNDHSNVRIAMLKFLAGPEAYIVDMIVDELKKIKNEKGDGQLTIYDVLKNTEFFKNLLSIKEYASENFGRLRTEIADEYEKINNVDGTGPKENDSIYNAVPRGSTAVANALSATYRVGVRKVNEQVKNISEQMKNVNEGIVMEAGRMTREPQNPSDESVAARLVRRAAGIAPTSVLYGVAGAKMAAGRLSKWFWGTKADPKTNGDGPTTVDVDGDDDDDDDDKRKDEELRTRHDATATETEAKATVARIVPIL